MKTAIEIKEETYLHNAVSEIDMFRSIMISKMYFHFAEMGDLETASKIVRIFDNDREVKNKREHLRNAIESEKRELA